MVELSLERVRLIGSGTSNVYLYRDVKNGDKYTVKILKIDDDAMARRFKLEVAALKKLQYVGSESIQQLVSVIDTSSKKKMVISKYVEGTPFADVEFRVMSDAVKLDICKRLASTLKIIHDHGVIHRDIKLENIILQHNNVPVIIDFDLACKVENCDGVSGTLYYMAPEYSYDDASQWTKEEWRGIDVYALGIIFYFIWNYYQPFMEMDPEATIYEALKYKEQYSTYRSLSSNKSMNKLIEAMLNPIYKDRIKLSDVIRRLK